MPYIENEILERLITTMVEGFARVEKKLDHMNRLKECLDGDKFLDNVDLAELLGVSQRTLARYREKGIIRYYCMNENGEEPVPCLRDTGLPQTERKRKGMRQYGHMCRRPGFGCVVYYCILSAPKQTGFFLSYALSV